MSQRPSQDLQGEEWVSRARHLPLNSPCNFLSWASIAVEDYVYRAPSEQANISPHRQRYSLYLPLSRPSRTTSATSRAGSLAKDSLRSPKALSKELTGRVSSAIQTSKRRSTMNSRDAAYDEEEELRRAIEASKEEATSEPPEAVNKRAKRGRSDSEEYVSIANQFNCMRDVRI